MASPFPELLTSTQVCEALGYRSYKSLQRLIARKAINYIRLSSGAYRFRPESIRLFLAQREIKAG